jgi:hypothetical protein
MANASPELYSYINLLGELSGEKCLQEAVP